MRCVRKKVQLLLAVVMFMLLTHFAYAADIIYNKKETSGPGITSNMNAFPIDMSGFVQNADNPVVPVIATKSGIYEHDGKFYVKGESKGNFKLTGYCACSICGSGTGLTASGKYVRANHTISADTKVIPMGTVIILENAVGKDGQSYDGVYVVEDRGGGVKGDHIDIYRPTHDLAALVTYYGRAYGDVYIANEIDIATLSTLSYN